MKENKKENIIEIIIKNEKLKLSDFTKLFNPKIETAAKVGIDNKNIKNSFKTIGIRRKNTRNGKIKLVERKIMVLQKLKSTKI